MTAQNHIFGVVIINNLHTKEQVGKKEIQTVQWEEKRILGSLTLEPRHMLEKRLQLLRRSAPLRGLFGTSTKGKVTPEQSPLNRKE